jgi:signal transduction histidine kinase
LNTALTDFFEQYSEVTKIKFEYRYNVKTMIETNMALQIYRMVQEMVHNAVKHSWATEVDVILHEQKKKLYIQCKDNGVGMIIEESKKDKGLGIGSLKARAEMLGGKMFFTSKLKSGTEYFFEIPLKIK